MCCLQKSIHGLKQSPRAWYQEVDSLLQSIGCIKSSLDSNLYLSYANDQLVLILLFVDDLLITGTSEELIDTIESYLGSKYEMKDLGSV